MEIKNLNVKDSCLIRNHRFEDTRGSFQRLFDDRNLQGVDFDGIKNVNFSKNVAKGTVRGLHMQKGEGKELKVISCLSGSIIDLFVDCRPESDTFGEIGKVQLTADTPDSVLVPRGCLHSFLTLEENTDVIYFTDNYYFPQLEVSVSPFSLSVKNMWKPYEILSCSEKDKSSIDLNEFLESLNQENK